MKSFIENATFVSEIPTKIIDDQQKYTVCYIKKNVTKTETPYITTNNYSKYNASLNQATYSSNVEV